jgi:thiol-disulfide isomerase/thioredoxin
MSLVESKYFETGKTAPNFSLLDVVSNQQMDLTNLKGENGTVIMFICNHCPFVVQVNNELVKLANDYLSKGISFVAISSNDVNYYPQDGPIYMKQVALKLYYPFPYLYDESQKVAKVYDASCTPDFYLFDGDLKSVYHGQLDNSRPGNGIPVTGLDMRNAIDLLLKNELNTNLQKPSIGCGIKWK